MMDTVTLYRPTGPEELALVKASGYTKWPPRLQEQPIFYPVTNKKYAIYIASDWSVKSSGYGCVTRFLVRKAFMDRYATVFLALFMVCGALAWPVLSVAWL